MEGLLNEKVEHKRFGTGTIIIAGDGKVTVRFSEELGEKTFQYPDAFEQYLKIYNPLLLEKVQEEFKEKKNLVKMENEKRRLEMELRDKELKREKLELAKKRKRAAK